MRKTYWLLTAFIFCAGVLLGVVGHMYYGTVLQPGADQPSVKENATKVDSSAIDISKYPLPDPTIKGNDAGIGSVDLSDPKGGRSEEITLSGTEQEKIVSDYKQALGILFDAWKVKDLPTFRTTLAKAYTGEIMESHIQKAEKFLPKGIGLYVTEVNFDNVNIESADKYSATVNAIYRYTVRDYDLDEKYPFGEEFSHFVHVRANLVKIDSHWMITGETVI